MQLSLNTRKIIFIVAALFCLLPLMSSPLALLLGLIVAQLMDHPFAGFNAVALTGF